MKAAKLSVAFLMLVGVGLGAGEKEKLAEELLVVSGTPEQLKQVSVQIRKMQEDMLRRQLNVPEEQKEKLIAFQQKVVEKVTDSMSWDKMKDDFIRLYAEVYAEDELKALIAFMKSPVGQKMISKNPELMRKVMMLTQEKMMKLMPEINKMTKDFAAEVKAAAQLQSGEAKGKDEKKVAAPAAGKTKP